MNGCCWSRQVVKTVAVRATWKQVVLDFDSRSVTRYRRPSSKPQPDGVEGPSDGGRVLAHNGLDGLVEQGQRQS